jgi:hypothetical protein
MEDRDPRPPPPAPGNLVAIDAPWTRSLKELKVGISYRKQSLNKPHGGLAMGERHAKQVWYRPRRVVAAARERDMVQANYPPGCLRIRHGSPLRVANAADLF